MITDSVGAVVGSSEYDAFGTRRTPTGIQYRFGFTGEQRDAETGFIYLRARYYEPAVGRFVSKDPFPGFLDDPESLNRFAYVSNNPLNYVDPSGRIGIPGLTHNGGGGPPVGAGALATALARALGRHGEQASGWIKNTERLTTSGTCK